MVLVALCFLSAEILIARSRTLSYVVPQQARPVYVLLHSFFPDSTLRAKMKMYHANIATYYHPEESPLSPSTVYNPAGAPRHIRHRAREAKLSEPSPTSRLVSSSSAFDAVTVKHLAPALTFAPGPATSAPGTGSSWTLSGTSFTSSALDNQMTSSQLLAETAALPFSTAHAASDGTIQHSSSSRNSGPTPSQTATASTVNNGSARTTGIIIGSVLGGSAVLLMVGLAIVYVTRRRRRGDQADGDTATQQRCKEAPDGTGDTTGGRKRSATSPMALPLQGATTAPTRILRSEPIIIDTISPITPIMPHLSRWTSEKADIPSPEGHPAADVLPHLRHHPLFADARHDHNGGDNDDVSPPSSGSPSSGPPLPLAAEAENAVPSSFLLFESPSSRSSTRRPSTRDSSAPHTALTVPPPHRPPPRRRHTRAAGRGRGGVASAASSRRGSGSSVGGDFEGGGSGDGFGGVFGHVERHERPPTPPPPLPARNAARSKSLRDVERPTVWI